MGCRFYGGRDSTVCVVSTAQPGTAVVAQCFIIGDSLMRRITGVLPKDHDCGSARIYSEELSTLARHAAPCLSTAWNFRRRAEQRAMPGLSDKNKSEYNNSRAPMSHLLLPYRVRRVWGRFSSPARSLTTSTIFFRNLYQLPGNACGMYGRTRTNVLPTTCITLLPRRMYCPCTSTEYRPPRSQTRFPRDTLLSTILASLSPLLPPRNSSTTRARPTRPPMVEEDQAPQRQQASPWPTRTC